MGRCHTAGGRHQPPQAAAPSLEWHVGPAGWWPAALAGSCQVRELLLVLAGEPLSQLQHRHSPRPRGKRCSSLRHHQPDQCARLQQEEGAGGRQAAGKGTAPPAPPDSPYNQVMLLPAVRHGPSGKSQRLVEQGKTNAASRLKATEGVSPAHRPPLQLGCSELPVAAGWRIRLEQANFKVISPVTGLAG